MLMAAFGHSVGLFLYAFSYNLWFVSEDGELHLTLQKAKPGETWPGALKGHGQVYFRRIYWIILTEPSWTRWVQLKTGSAWCWRDSKQKTQGSISLKQNSMEMFQIHESSWAGWSTSDHYSETMLVTRNCKHSFSPARDDADTCNTFQVWCAQTLCIDNVRNCQHRVTHLCRSIAAATCVWFTLSSSSTRITAMTTITSC